MEKIIQEIIKEAGYGQRAKEKEKNLFYWKLSEIKDLEVFEKEMEKLDNQKLKQLSSYYENALFPAETVGRETASDILDRQKAKIIYKIRENRMPRRVPLPKVYQTFTGV